MPGTVQALIFKPHAGLLLVPLRSGDARERARACVAKQCRYASPSHLDAEQRYETRARCGCFLCVVRVCGRWVWAARVHVMTYALELTADLRGAPRARRVLCGQRALVCISSTVTRNKTSEAHARPCRHGHQYTTLTRTTDKHAHSLRRREKRRERERRRPGSCPSPLLLLLRARLCATLMIFLFASRHADTHDLSDTRTEPTIEKEQLSVRGECALGRGRGKPWSERLEARRGASLVGVMSLLRCTQHLQLEDESEH